MKKIHKILILIITILLIALIAIIFLTKPQPKNTSYDGLKKYVSEIYGKTFLIPEFNDINQADEDWLYENINQYVWSNSEYEEKNNKEFGYTYEDITNILKKLYGSNFTKETPKELSNLRYNPNTEMYGPTSYGLEYHYDYVIDNISQNENTFTVSIYDYTISYFRTLGDNPENLIDIYNNTDFLLNGDNGTPIISISTLDDEKYKNILDYKEKLSHKTLTIVFDENTQNYAITACKYEDTQLEDIVAKSYTQMQATFEVWNIQYDYEELYTSDEVLVENFEELSSIYTENALETYKKEMSLFNFKNDNVYIEAGDINVGSYIANIQLQNVEKIENIITCDVKRTFRKSFDENNPLYNETYEITDKFIIKLINNEWKIEQFNYNNNENIEQ